ncbi:hypothetical protein ACFOVU_01340 [Nocardiopsis sediminis]|uniref:DUF4232 domain-containing protein n=1 Tax=Nocardiopsis sediminis TaxID=1778267 RepID=A0ABV8FHV8_9ACTN
MSPETYWKRRVFVLLGLLVVVALITYACTRPSSSDIEQTAGEGADPAPEPSQSAEPSSPPSVPPSPSPSDGSSPSGDAGEDGDAQEGDAAEEAEGEGGSGGDSGAAAAEVPAPERDSDPCRPQDIVVTVGTDRDDYAWDAEPELELNVVNTGEQTCTVDVGPESMELRITSGDDRIFSTADCVEGDTSDEVQVRRGVPHTATYTWDRKRSWTDCRDDDVNADRPGTYVATLHGTYDTGTEPAVFRLN